MTDIFTKEKRSEIMRQVKPQNNKSTELRLIKIFKDYKITGWRRHYPVKGHPDFVFMSSKIAIFVDGCFWHGHECRHTLPKDNRAFWENKITKNKRHDKEITALFEARGWKVLRIWECELRKNRIPVLLKKFQEYGLIAKPRLHI